MLIGIIWTAALALTWLCAWVVWSALTGELAVPLLNPGGATPMSFAALIDYTPMEGFLMSILVVVLMIVLVPLMQNVVGGDAKEIRRYRYAEDFLISLGKLSMRDLVDYHRSYIWSAYGGVALSSSIVVAALLIEYEPKEFDSYLLMGLSTGLLAASGFCFICSDIIHVNTLTPLAPPSRRLKIVGRVLIVSGIGVGLFAVSVLGFMAMAHPIAPVIGALTLIFALSSLTNVRGLPKEELVEFFQLSDEEWTQLVEAVKNKRTLDVDHAPVKRRYPEAETILPEDEDEAADSEAPQAASSLEQESPVAEADSPAPQDADDDRVADPDADASDPDSPPLPEPPGKA
jgi:hypothetical protein